MGCQSCGSCKGTEQLIAAQFGGVSQLCEGGCLQRSVIELLSYPCNTGWNGTAFLWASLEQAAQQQDEVLFPCQVAELADWSQRSVEGINETL
ncbi:hypothetical protein SB9_22800 [Pseudomonas oryzihabitans]|nr:hypothetical protein SB9_22800 [Pseudomonas psychrotolerans]